MPSKDWRWEFCRFFFVCVEGGGCPNLFYQIPLLYFVLSGQKWRVATSEVANHKKLENKLGIKDDIDWVEKDWKDAFWILPATGGTGPIEYSNPTEASIGKVLNVNDDQDMVELVKKEMDNRQKWKKDVITDSTFRLTVEDGNMDKHLAAASNTVLTGKIGLEIPHSTGRPV